VPFPLPADFDNSEWKPSGDFVVVDEGLYNASIFTAELLDFPSGKGYKITFRIDQGPFDGEDVVLQYAGLGVKTIFRIYEILKAIGTIDQFYDADLAKWKAFPAPDDMEGKFLQIQVENEPFQAREAKKDGGALKFNDDGTPKMLDSARPTRFFSNTETVTFRPTIKKQAAAAGAPSAGGVPSVPGVPPTAQQTSANVAATSVAPW